ncbi:MAG: hydrogenase maturation nickel metallochaperone HypA [Verrucomicrobiae bacterium]|nr:hydrogenase maturation nickel metallochaperone HypA [Verrucomicrobiae bacterium]MDW8342932.1 hydrogenase maturation nickel metallochaperone HypA [Verrucomicrobiae bacterium]
MHEMSIVAALIDEVRQHTSKHPGARVSVVRLRVGALRQVIPEWLQFCFVTATRDTDLAGVELEIEPVPARARCRLCQRTFAVEDSWFECPGCGALGGELIQGNELELVSLVLAEATCARQ